MLTALRSWLADRLRPAPVPAALPSSEKDEPASADGDEARRAARLLRRRREAEEEAKSAEERAKRLEERLNQAEKARKAAEEKARTLDLELAQTRERARSAEARAKKAGEERPKRGGRRGGPAPAPADASALEHRLRASEEEVHALRTAQEDLERRLAHAQARADAEATRRERLQARLDDAERSPGAAVGRAVPARRDLPRTALDAHFSPGDECLFAICRQIETAERSADVCVFTITDDRIAARLLDAHRRGVQVRIITDNDKAHDEGSDVHRLSRAGIAVVVDETPSHMHHKFAIFDDRRMLTGSYNWTRAAARDNQENLIVTDDARLLKPFAREFAALWEKLRRP